jgi:hypothetical protein
MLTPVGMKQAQELGAALRARYLLPDSALPLVFTPADVYLRSSLYGRTVATLQARTRSCTRVCPSHRETHTRAQHACASRDASSGGVYAPPRTERHTRVMLARVVCTQ